MRALHQKFSLSKSTVKKRNLKLQCNAIRSTVAAPVEEFLSFLVWQIKYRTNNSQPPHPIPKVVNPVRILAQWVTTLTLQAKDRLTLDCSTLKTKALRSREKLETSYIWNIVNVINICEKWGAHSGLTADQDLLECYAVLIGNIWLFPLSHFRLVYWPQYIITVSLILIAT